MKKVNLGVLINVVGLLLCFVTVGAFVFYRGFSFFQGFILKTTLSVNGGICLLNLINIRAKKLKDRIN